MDGVNGTSFNAESAACALGVIEKRKVLVHCDRAVRAGACALGATDTAVCAHLTCDCALVVVRAADRDDGAVLLHLDGAVRTVLCAETATGAEAGDDFCDAVCYDDSIVGTSSRAIAKTYAGVGADVFALPMLCGFFTSLEAVAEMFFIFFGGFTGAVASDVSKELDSFSCFNAEDRCDILRCRISAGNAEVGLADLALGKSTCVAVTAAVAAGAAVCSGKGITDSEEFFVLLYAEEDVGNGKYDRADDRDRKTDKNGNKYCHNFSASLCEKIFNDSRKAVERHSDDRSGNKGYGKSAEAFRCIRIVELGAYAREEKHCKQESETYAE